MGAVEVRDYVLCPKRTHGNASLREKLLALRAGAIVKLVVGGLEGTRVMMDDSKPAASASGLKALEAAQTHCHALVRDQQGAVVESSRP